MNDEDRHMKNKVHKWIEQEMAPYRIGTTSVYKLICPECDNYDNELWDREDFFDAKDNYSLWKTSNSRHGNCIGCGLNLDGYRNGYKDLRRRHIQMLYGLYHEIIFEKSDADRFKFEILESYDRTQPKLWKYDEFDSSEFKAIIEEHNIDYINYADDELVPFDESDSCEYKTFVKEHNKEVKKERRREKREEKKAEKEYAEKFPDTSTGGKGFLGFPGLELILFFGGIILLIVIVVVNN